MTRFILLTFGFLGWSFYELSGGADYEPRSDRDPVFAPVVARAATDPVGAVPLVSTRQTATPAVTQASIPASIPASLVQNASLSTGLPDEEPAQIAVEPAKAAVVTPAAAPAVTETRVAITFDTPATSDAPEVADAPADMRKVTGNRVNMRGGPGTGYSVVGKLTKGAEVEVLRDPGTGWLKLRSVESGQVGWMADWLVTADAQ